MRCAIYRRVSTDMQREEGFSLEAQKMRLEAYAISQGWTIVDDYNDEGYSAKNMDRPELQRLLSDMEKQKFDVILVYRLDRLTRSVLDLHHLLKSLDENDVVFQSATESYETKTSNGRMMISIIATLAQWERETIAERVYESMLRRSETGQRNGAPAPFGYDSNDGKLIQNKDEAKWVKFIFSQYGTHGSQNIAKKLNSRGVRTKKGEIWSDFSVRYTLRNPIYAGFIRWNYESTAKGKRQKTGEEVIQPIKQDDFEPIIDKETFDETQRLINQRSSMAFRSDNHYPFSGIAKCSKCGKSFSGAKRERKAGGEYRFYKCQGRFKFGTCDVQTIAEESMEKEFLELLSFDNPELNLESQLNNDESFIDEEMIEKQLQKLENKKSRLKELYLEGDIPKPEYKKRMDEFKEEELDLKSLKNEQDDRASVELMRTIMENIKNEWHNLSYESKKKAVQTLFNSMTIDLVEPTRPGKYPKPPVIKITDYEFR